MILDNVAKYDNIIALNSGFNRSHTTIIHVRVGSLSGDYHQQLYPSERGEIPNGDLVKYRHASRIYNLHLPLLRLKCSDF